ncbi:urokinase-type plasminogen activator-like [Scleropages formosus]|uniref:trypsin n=1 Tax=Scleropages formosus TaxID=113540 RepID=A0A0P7T8W1_SCLFO|nr:urokinase-type plasminogen activator-like [Scleropages formosus]
MKPGKNLTVLLGTQDLRKKQGSVRVRVKFYHFYPGYDDVLLRNDILLLQLEEPARGGTIQKIALPKKDRDVKPKTLCSVAGWGKTKDRGPVQQHLMEANVTAVDRKVCKTAWGARVTANMLCAGGSVDRKGFCKGDSGGPLVCKNAAEGIVSFFEKGECGSPTKPNVYTQVSRYLPWIKSIMKTSFGGEIVHGKKAAKNFLRFMASVQREGKHVCGGFLISPKFVLTAAHCDKGGNMTVVLGTHNLKMERNIQIFRVVRKYRHPKYEDVLSGNDIMLLQLSKPVPLSKTVKKVNIPVKDKAVKADSACVVAGWGKNETRGRKVADLLFATVKTIGSKECQRAWDAVKVKLPADTICAGGYESNKGACQGDSGGPLVCSGLAVGIVSFNLLGNCDYPNVPNVYTQISKFLPWIKKTTKSTF